MGWIQTLALALFILAVKARMEKKMDDKFKALAAQIGAGLDTTNANLTEIKTDLESLKAAAEEDGVSDETLALFEALAAKVGATEAHSREIADIVPPAAGSIVPPAPISEE